MSAIQRWDMFAEVGINEPVKYDMWEAVEGRYVLYADHVAAVAAAEQRIRTHEGCADAERAEGYDAGFTDALGKARDAVDGERRSYYADCVNDGYQPDPRAIAAFRLSLAAIDGVEKP